MAYAVVVRDDKYLDICAPQPLHRAIEGVVRGGVVIHGDEYEAEVVECRHVEEFVGVVEDQYGIWLRLQARSYGARNM